MYVYACIHVRLVLLIDYLLWICLLRQQEWRGAFHFEVHILPRCILFDFAYCIDLNVHLLQAQI